MQKKINDNRLNDFEQALEQRLSSVSGILVEGKLQTEMKRFIPTDVYDRTLGKEKFSDYLSSSLSKLLAKLKVELYRISKSYPHPGLDIAQVLFPHVTV